MAIFFFSFSRCILDWNAESQYVRPGSDKDLQPTHKYFPAFPRTPFSVYRKGIRILCSNSLHVWKKGLDTIYLIAFNWLTMDYLEFQHK